MIEKLTGVIFKTIPYSETSLVMDIFSLQKGLHSYIVSGVRKKKSSKIGLYKPMTFINFVAYQSNKDTLHRIKEADYHFMYKKLPNDIVRSTMAMFMIDLCRNTIKESETNIELFDFIKNSFLALDETESLSNIFHLSFAIELSRYLGFFPDLRTYEDGYTFDLTQGLFIPDISVFDKVISANLSKDLFHLASKNIPEVGTSKTDRNQLLDAILHYYRLHIPNFKGLPSLEVCRVIFS